MLAVVRTQLMAMPTSVSSQPPALAANATLSGPSSAVSTSSRVAEKSQTSRSINYDDFQIDDPRKRDGPVGYSVTDSLPPKPAPDLSGYIVQRPAGRSMSSATPPSAVSPGPAANPAPTPVPAPAPAAATAPAASSGGDPWANIEAADLDDLQKKMPKWTKGPPCTSEEIDEYKAFMVTKYEAEQKLNAEILRRKKLGLL